MTHPEIVIAFVVGFAVGMGFLSVLSMVIISGNISERERRNGKDE